MMFVCNGYVLKSVMICVVYLIYALQVNSVDHDFSCRVYKDFTSLAFL